MSTTLPQPITKQPPRDGLAYYECLADGFIHAAVTFDIAQDKRFVAHVAALAWTNGATAVCKKIQHSAHLAKRLHEELETGRSPTIALCTAVQTAVEASGVYTGIRQYYQSSGTEALSCVHPENSGTIRRIVAEAVLAGMSCRGIAPKLYDSIVATASMTGGEQNFLGSLLIEWLETGGLPTAHPFLQMVRSFYRRKPHERRLISELISPMLIADLEHGALGGMWRPAEWMQTGWQLGVNQSAYAPDTLEDVFEEAGEDNLTYCKQLYRDCILPNLKPDLALPDLPAAFELYLGKSKDCQLHVPRVRQFNKRIFVARAFDFAAWMGFLSGR